MYHVVVYHSAAEIFDVANLINEAVQKERYKISVRLFTDRYEAAAFVNLNPFMCDIAVIDFNNMTEKDLTLSMRLAKKINKCRPSTQFIFISNVTVFSPVLYQITHTYYLSKPLNVNKIKKAIKKAVNNLESISSQYYIPFPMMIGKRIYIENLYNVMYLKTVSRYTEIYTIKNVYKSRASLIQLEKEQLDDHFIRCHKSFIINAYYVKEAGSNEIILIDDTVIPVSRKFSKEHEEKILASLTKK